MNTYLQSVLANIAGQFVQLVMIPFVLAYCLQWVGSRIRLIGVGLAASIERAACLSKTSVARTSVMIRPNSNSVSGS